MRERLAEAGVAPCDAAVGTVFNDDPDVKLGVLATRDGRSFSFDFRENDRLPPADYAGEARLDRWEELTEPREKWMYEDHTRLARRILGL